MAQQYNIKDVKSHESSHDRKVKELEEEISTTKYNKRTQHHIGLAKAKLARIKEEYQNRGIGAYVFNEIFKIYKRKGYKRFIGIANKDSKVMTLYQKLGLYQSGTDILIEKRLR